MSLTSYLAAPSRDFIKHPRWVLQEYTIKSRIRQVFF